MPKRGKGHRDAQEKSVESPLTLQPDYQKAFPSFYSNFAVISHSPMELCIDFCAMAPPLSVDLRKNTASIPVVARVMIPPAMVAGLVEALQAQIQKFEETRKNLASQKAEVSGQ